MSIFLDPLVTFVTGSLVVFLYYRQKKDDKRRIAKIVLLEIENAQAKLNEAKLKVLANPDDPLPEHLYSMSTNTWTPNKHMFVKDFYPAELTAINNFYETCEIFDEAIRHNDSRFAEGEREVRKNVHEAVYKYAIECSEKLLKLQTDEDKESMVQEYFSKMNSAMTMLTTGKFMYQYTPSKQNHIVKSCVENIDTNLSFNTAGAKLKKLSEGHWLW